MRGDEVAIFWTTPERCQKNTAKIQKNSINQGLPWSKVQFSVWVCLARFHLPMTFLSLPAPFGPLVSRIPLIYAIFLALWSYLWGSISRSTKSCPSQYFVQCMVEYI